MISFDAFCDKQFISGDDRQAFKAWLGNTVNAKISEDSWLKWFAEWVRCNVQ